MSNSTLSAHIAPGRDVLFNLIKSIPQTLKYQPGTIVAEGDFVIVHGRFSGFGAPVNWIAADIVRIEAGILAEHWDVIQDEATEEQSKSGAPMFGAHVRNYIPDLRWKKNKSRRVGLPMTTPPIIRAALASNWSALCQAKWLRFLPSGIGSCCGSGSAAVFLRASSDVEIALREAFANAIIHGNHESPRKQVYVRCRRKVEEVSNRGKGRGTRI